MRILLASSSSGSQGGGEIFLDYLGRALHAQGHTIGLWASDHDRMNGLVARMGSYAEILRAPYQNTYDLPGRCLQAYWSRGQRELACRTWKSWNPEFIHLNKQNLEDGLDLVRALNQIHTPSLITAHITQSASYLGAANASARDAVSRWALKSYRGPFITVSDQRQVELRTFLESTRAAIDTVYNGIPRLPTIPTDLRTSLRAQLGIQEEHTLVTMVGRLTAQKCPKIFLEQAVRTIVRFPEARFLWIGSGDAAAMFDAEVIAHGLQGMIKRLEWQHNVSAWLGASDIYLHTAAYEGLPLALLEAMGAGLPCVTSSGVLAEAEPLRNGALISYDDDWTSLLASPEERQAKAQDCSQLFAQHFKAERMAQGYAAHYEKILSQRKAA